MAKKKINMMAMKHIINDVVLIVLENEEILRSVGIRENRLFAKILGYDDFGLWVKHPNYEIIISEDKAGKPLPVDKIVREKFDATVLIHWKFISTIVHFPNREGYDFPSPFEREIGFSSGEIKNGPKTE